MRRSSDNLGTVRDLAEYDDATDTTAIVDHYVYDAFGNETDHTGSTDFLFKYTGRAFDDATGLQNNLNRWYDPTVGRWLSEDPIGFEAGDANVYRNVGNSSTLATDPSGLAGFGIISSPTSIFAPFEIAARIGFKNAVNTVKAVAYGAVATKQQVEKVASDVAKGNIKAAAKRHIGWTVGVACSSAVVGMPTPGNPFGDPNIRRMLETAGPVIDNESFERGEASGPFVDAAASAAVGAATLHARAASARSVTDKLYRYLLNPDHPVGGDKAAWFKRALGFDRSNLNSLARQIRFDPCKATRTAATEHGVKYNQVISIKGANGKIIEVKVAWIRNKDGIVRMVTAVPN